VAKLVDAPGLGPDAVKRVGSSQISRTTLSSYIYYFFNKYQ